MRRLYIVAYDISNPRRLHKVFKMLKGFGERLQFSIFQCFLTARARVEMQAALGEIIHHEEDRVLIIDLGPVESGAAKSVQGLGRQAPVSEKGVMVI